MANWHAGPLGEQTRGLKHMLEMVNFSRVSHLARAAGMMCAVSTKRGLRPAHAMRLERP